MQTHTHTHTISYLFLKEKESAERFISLSLFKTFFSCFRVLEPLLKILLGSIFVLQFEIYYHFIKKKENYELFFSIFLIKQKKNPEMKNNYYFLFVFYR